MHALTEIEKQSRVPFHYFRLIFTRANGDNETADLKGKKTLTLKIYPVESRRIMNDLKCFDCLTPVLQGNVCSKLLFLRHPGNDANS